jgi:GntR family transcriptional regulator
MKRLLGIDFSDAVPIWKQIEDGVRRLVASGSLAPGDAVPSVRELARELRVNPATVSKAYQRLTDSGVLAVRRGEGTFVAHRPADEVDAERRDLLAEQARRFAEAARTMRAGRKEALEELRRAWAALDEEGGGGER